MIALLPLAALGADPEDLLDLPLDELLEVQVVTATAKAGPRSASPVAVHVVTAEEIRRRGYTDLAALLDDLPGIDVHERSSPDLGNLVTVRGLTGNQRLLVLVDGFRAQAPSGDPHSIGANFALVDAERVEVVLGPASALHGADAFAGVVNVVTRTGDDIDGWRIGGEVGQYATERGELLAGSRIGVVRWSVAAARYRTDGPNLAEAYPEDFAWYHDRYLPEGEMLASTFGDAVVTVDPEPFSAPTEAYYLHLRVRVGELDVGWLRHGDARSSSIGSRPELALYVDEARFAYAIDAFHARHTHEMGEVQVHTGVSLSNWAYEPDTRYLNSFSGYQGGYKHASALLVAIEERVAVDVAPWLAVTGGGTLGWLDALAETPDLDEPYDPRLPGALQGFVYPGSGVVDESGRDLSVPVQFDPVRSTRTGVFAEAQVVPVDPVAVTLGARWDQDSRYGSALDPRVGLIFRPAPAVAIRASFGEAFLSPAPLITLSHFGRFEPALDADGDVVGLRSDYWRLGNADVGPERLRSLDAGFRHTGDWLTFGADAWRADVRDLIVTQTTLGGEFAGWPVTVAERAVNAGTARTYGVTAEAEARVPAGAATLGPRVAWTWTEGSITDQPLPYASTHAIEGGVDLGWGPVSAAVSAVARTRAHHPSLRDAYGEPVAAPGHAVADLYARYAPVIAEHGLQIALSARVTNLFDARWYRVSDDYPDAFGASPQDPRRVVAGLEIGL